jgi:hypothetical protein
LDRQLLGGISRSCTAWTKGPLNGIALSQHGYSGEVAIFKKKYARIAHIPDAVSGMRFDFSVMPGYNRNKTLSPNVGFETSYFP